MMSAGASALSTSAHTRSVSCHWSRMSALAGVPCAFNPITVHLPSAAAREARRNRAQQLILNRAAVDRDPYAGLSQGLRPF